MFRVCHAFLSVHWNLVDTCRESANLLAFLYVTFYCVFVTFPYCVLGQVWYLIVSIPDLRLLTYFAIMHDLVHDVDTCYLMWPYSCCQE